MHERAMEGTVAAASAAEGKGSPPEKKVRVLFVPGFVADTYSEIEKQYVELCARRDASVEFLWLVPDISCRYNRFAREQSRTTLREPVWVPHLRRCNIPYVVGNISAFNPISNFLLFRRIFSKWGIDAVYTHFGFERFWAVLFGKLFGKVTIWNEHWHSLGTTYVLPKKLFYRLFVDEFIAVSGFIANTLPPGYKTHTVRNAIYTNDCTSVSAAERTSLRRRLGIPEADKVVLLVSAFRPNKRHDLAVEVCSRVLRERDDTCFVFLGAGSTYPSIQRIIRELGYDDRILMPGHVYNVDDYYLVADVCMLTSLGEPCALAVVESMKYGRPLVAFESGGTPEIIKSGKTGMLAPEEDVDQFTQRLLELLENDELRVRIGRNALQAVHDEADRDAWIARLRKLLEGIVQRNVRASLTNQ